ncbi:dormancy-associated protein 1-like isoform X2 [Rutidosis leptorrhynchoides]|uniref:dormancy-associated protein 1-like isoform X2 n=1 Tax=Rutidosis leptorrhynchoides TaxID=125765 RepID=UPI003A99E147
MYPNLITMVLIDQMWDESVAGPPPQHGHEKLPNVVTMTNKGEGSSSKFKKSLSMPETPTTPGTPTTPSPTAARKENVWRSVFNPGSNLATRGIGSNYFDKPSTVGSPTVYDCGELFWDGWIS